MASITTKDKRYDQRAFYVNEILNNTFKPLEDIRGIKYAVTDTSKEVIKEIVRVESWLGVIAYLDVTAMPEEKILKSVVHLTMAEGEPQNLITDENAVRKVARMF